MSTGRCWLSTWNSKIQRGKKARQASRLQARDAIQSKSTLCWLRRVRVIFSFGPVARVCRFCVVCTYSSGRKGTVVQSWKVRRSYVVIFPATGIFAVLTKEEMRDAKMGEEERLLMDKGEVFVRWKETALPCHAVLRDESELPLLQERIVYAHFEAAQPLIRNIQKGGGMTSKIGRDGMTRNGCYLCGSC